MKTKGKEQTFDYSYNAPEKITGIKDWNLTMWFIIKRGQKNFILHIVIIDYAFMSQY